MSEHLIEIKDLAFSYTDRPILKRVNMTMSRGQVIAIMGGSGSGKTTLLRLIGGEVKPSAGSCRSCRSGRPSAQQKRIVQIAQEDGDVIPIRRIVYGFERI